MDRIEKEINDILEQLEELPGDGSRTPVSLDARRRQQQQQRPSRPVPTPPRKTSSMGQSFNPATLMLVGAGMVLSGYVLSSAVAKPLIWVSFTGIIVFFVAFGLSFWLSGRTANARRTQASQRGVYWRDRYIEYGPADANPSPTKRIKRWFRR